MSSCGYKLVFLVIFIQSHNNIHYVFGQSSSDTPPGINAITTADTLNCPLGYSWNGYACYSFDTETLICPSGYYWNGQMCLSMSNLNTIIKCSYTEQNRSLENAPEIIPPRMLNVITPNIPDPFTPEIVCPIDYRWNGYQCSQTFTIKTTCPSDYEIVDGQCQRSVHGSCPTSEYQLINSECIYESSVDVSCPAGYWKDVNHCVHSMPSCLDGYSLVDGICVKSIIGNCPMGTSMYNGKCISRDVSNVNCPQGYGWNGKECVHSTASCPEGYNMINDKCERVSFTEADFLCPPLTTLSNRTCVSLEKFCLNGFILINGTCIENATICDNGYNYENGKCVKVKCEPEVIATTTVQPISPVPYCPDGYILQDLECIKYETSTANPPTASPTWPPISPICPDGYIFHNYRCLKSGAHQPPISVPHIVKPTCPFGYILEGGDCVSIFEIPSETESPSEVSPICPNGYELKDNKCYISQGQNPTPPVIIVCPHGFKYVNGTCIITTGTDDGSSTDIPKVDIPVYPLDPCPFGYSWSNGSCIKATPICPDGFVFFKDACYLKPTSHPDTEEIPTTTQNTYWEVHTSHIPPQYSDCPPCGQPICPVCNQSTAGTKDIHISNVINNNNTIYNPVNISTINENHIILHLDSDGGISVGKSPQNDGGDNRWSIKVVKDNNNDTYGPLPPGLAFDSSEIVQIDSSNSSVTNNHNGISGNDSGVSNRNETKSKEKCCELLSPRQCKQEGDEWTCYHRKYHRCGDFCTQPKIYLKPKANNFRDNILVIKPPPPRFARLMPYLDDNKQKATGESNFFGI